MGKPAAASQVAARGQASGRRRHLSVRVTERSVREYGQTASCGVLISVRPAADQRFGDPAAFAGREHPAGLAGRVQFFRAQAVAPEAARGGAVLVIDLGPGAHLERAGMVGRSGRRAGWADVAQFVGGDAKLVGVVAEVESFRHVKDLGPTGASGRALEAAVCVDQERSAARGPGRVALLQADVGVGEEADSGSRRVRAVADRAIRDGLADTAVSLALGQARVHDPLLAPLALVAAGLLLALGVTSHLGLLIVRRGQRR
ncbi:hypothetical protein ACH49M_32630 [Rhodococcus qingshengii]|uniref:hypothetical protein n=1 Tax=Rhodococcus qingshengii TaxID=334542 RepID=UPI0037911E69